MTKKYLLLLSLAFLTCKGQNEKMNVKCEGIYEKYMDARFKNDYELSEKLIDHLISCESDDLDFRYEKVKVLISVKRYDDAISELDFITEHKPLSFYFLLKGTLMIKTNMPESYNNLIISEQLLDQELESSSLPTQDLLVQKVLLDNYFNENFQIEETFKRLGNGKSKIEDERVLNHLKSEIENNSAEKVMFNFFNID